MGPVEGRQGGRWYPSFEGNGHRAAIYGSATSLACALARLEARLIEPVQEADFSGVASA
jgi:hypothetical protein